LAENEIKVRPDVYTQDALAWVRYKQKRLAEAESAAEKALALHSPEPAFYYHAGLIAAALGKSEECVLFLNRAVALNPDFDPVQSANLKRVLANIKK
jgi:tetratricopeptide (TPR) repeat protein